MNPELVRQRLRKNFSPFAVRLGDGRTHDVLRPGLMAVGRHVIIIIDKNGHPVQVDPSKIISLDNLPAEAAPD